MAEKARTLNTRSSIVILGYLKTHHSYHAIPFIINLDPISHPCRHATYARHLHIMAAITSVMTAKVP